MALTPEMAKHLAPGFDPVPLSKELLRSIRSGTLATLADGGAPFATLTSVATDACGTPIILVSGLSHHTRHLERDARCSLLLGQTGKGDPLAHPRIGISCRAIRLERGSPEQARAERRYLNRHPKAKLYVGFPDFAFFRLDPLKASLNGGFGKAYALTAAELLIESPANAGLAASEQSAVVHMNDDHRDAVDVYARAFAGARSDGWYIIGLDADGIDIGHGDEARRVFFPAPLASAAELRTALVDLAKAGRRILAERE